MYHIGCDHIYNPDGQESMHVTFVFKFDELMYDVKNYAWIEGEVLGEDAQHAQHVLVEIGEEGNEDRAKRIFDVVHAGATEILYPYTKCEAEDGETLSDELQNKDEYRIELNVPSTMSRTTLNLLHKLIHEYFVYRAMHDWLTMTFPQAAQHWLDKATEAAQEIQSAKNARTGVLRRKPYPL